MRDNRTPPAAASPARRGPLMVYLAAQGVAKRTLPMWGGRTGTATR